MAGAELTPYSKDGELASIQSCQSSQQAEEGAGQMQDSGESRIPDEDGDEAASSMGEEEEDRESQLQSPASECFNGAGSSGTPNNI